MWRSKLLGILVSISYFSIIHAKMPSFLDLKCLGKLCSSEKSKVTSSERTTCRGSYRRRLVVEDMSVTGSPYAAHRRATVTHLLYLHPEVCCTFEHLFKHFDPLGK